jgi:hypothetical protein
MVVHAGAKRKLPDGDTTIAAQLEEERKVKAVLAELEKLGADTEQFTRQLVRASW